MKNGCLYCLESDLITVILHLLVPNTFSIIHDHNMVPHLPPYLFCRSWISFFFVYYACIFLLIWRIRNKSMTTWHLAKALIYYWKRSYSFEFVITIFFWHTGLHINYSVAKIDDKTEESTYSLGLSELEWRRLHNISWENPLMGSLGGLREENELVYRLVVPTNKKVRSVNTSTNFK